METKGSSMKFGIKALAVATAALALAPAANAGDAAKGAKVFKKCKACHKVGDKAKNSIGPILNNVIGRTAGTEAGYKYSKSMKAAGAAGLVWDEAKITDYLENPTAYLRKVLDDPKAKAKMGFKTKKLADRENVAAYVATFSQ